MSTFTYNIPTNDKKGSHYDVLGHLMPARIFVSLLMNLGKTAFLFAVFIAPLKIRIFSS